MINGLESENDLLDLIEGFRVNNLFNEPVFIRKFLEFFAVLNTAVPNDEILVGKKKDRRLIRGNYKLRISDFNFLY